MVTIFRKNIFRPYLNFFFSHKFLFFTFFGESFFHFQFLDIFFVHFLKSEKTFPKNCKKQKFRKNKNFEIFKIYKKKQKPQNL